MGKGDDRHSKSTAELERGELAKLAIRSVRAPTDPSAPDDDEITIARDPKAVLDDVAGAEPMLHEEVASSSLIAQALAQLEAGGPDEELRVRRPIVQTTEISPIEDLASLGRGAPMTIPSSPNRLAEIASSAPASETISTPNVSGAAPAKPSRPAIEMKSIERPLAEARPIETSFAVGTKPLEMPVPEHIASGSPHARPVAPRSDVSLMIVAIVVILAIAATIAGFVLSR